MRTNDKRDDGRTGIKVLANNKDTGHIPFGRTSN